MERIFELPAVSFCWRIAYFLLLVDCIIRMRLSGSASNVNITVGIGLLIDLLILWTSFRLVECHTNYLACAWVTPSTVMIYGSLFNKFRK